MPGFEHRIGGLEKQNLTGNVSYDPENHEFMCKLRAEKVKRVLADIPGVEAYGDQGGTLVLSWGGTFGAIRSAVDAARLQGMKVGHVHLRWLNPLPANLAEVCAQFDQTLVAELNLGQLHKYLRNAIGLESESLAKIQGQPFKVSEVLQRITSLAAQS
jgi:2-oxoglutarate ferredoxin oxidoreductase subunit alpha